jgi:hypothetical protein
MVYVLAGLGHELTAVTLREEKRGVFDLKQEAADKDLERRLKIANTKLKHDERMAKLTAKPAATPQAVSQKPAEGAVKHYECVCGRVFDKSRSYNAHRRHCDIPANEPAKVYANGVAK